MTTQKHWASGWRTTQPPTRDANRDAFWAEFENDDGKSVRVSITEQELRGFGKPPEELNQKRQHTEAVLRAILETYVARYGIPNTVIDARDLGADLQSLKQEFLSNADRT